LKFRSPKYEEASINIPAEVARLQHSFNGIVCSKKGDEYSIENNIIDFLGEEPPRMTFAQTTNQWQLSALLYERIWRNRSLSIISGQSFPVEKEKALLNNWMAPEAGKTYLDIGCSTALYARALKREEADCNVIALDFSKPMLEEARKKAKAEQADLYILRTDARFMPFFGATFDGLMLGGTLNELADPLKVLYECKRVIKPGGTLFIMHLLQAGSLLPKLFQYSTGYSGLTFPSSIESNKLFERAGFSIADQYRIDIVCFTKLKKHKKNGLSNMAPIYS